MTGLLLLMGLVWFLVLGELVIRKHDARQRASGRPEPAERYWREWSGIPQDTPQHLAQRWDRRPA